MLRQITTRNPPLICKKFFTTSSTNGLLFEGKRRATSRFQKNKPLISNSYEEPVITKDPIVTKSSKSPVISDTFKKSESSITARQPVSNTSRVKDKKPAVGNDNGIFKKSEKSINARQSGGPNTTRIKGRRSETGDSEETTEISKPRLKTATPTPTPSRNKSNSSTKNTGSNSSYQSRNDERFENKKKKQAAPVPAKETSKIKINIPGFLSVTNLANILRVRTEDLLVKLEELGFENMTYNFILDNETASLIADEYGFEVSINEDVGVDLFPAPVSTDVKKLKPRAPIVTIMGHVDHGKTTILDYLRKSSIVDKEFGGITQHIGAFSVKTPKSKKMITFLDTPGHAAFLKMRERGANITDIVVLVVAADDSVMPQTKELIKHSKNAGVQMIVAINKCDKPQANPKKVIADLAAQGIDVEDYGGEIQTVQVSGKTGLGMEDLEEAIVTLAEMLDLKVEHKDIPAEGWVIESEVKKGLGSAATFLVTRGTLKPGSILVAGNTWCRVRSMKDEFGKLVKEAGPSIPVEITGWKDLPEAGDFAIQAKDENTAKKVVANRLHRAEQIEASKNIETLNELRLQELQLAKRNEKLEELSKLGLSLDDVKDSEEYADLVEDNVKKETQKCFYIVKADVSGSAEAIVESISGIGNDEVGSSVLYHEVGPPTENDIDRASAAGATILCFNVKIPKEVGNIAAKEGVTLKEHTVIYHLIEDVIEELTLKLPPIIDLKIRAKILLKQIFEITVKRQKVKVAGCRVDDGVLKRSSNVRVMRNGEEIWRGELNSLKREKDEVDEVKKGGDCGVMFKNWDKFEENDIIEVYEEEQVKRYL